MRAPAQPRMLPDRPTVVTAANVAVAVLLAMFAARGCPAGGPMAQAEPPAAPGIPNEEASASGIHRDCRFEILPLDARFFPEGPRPHPSSPGRAVLLDQCSGQSWVLVPHGGPEEAVWRRLGRE